MKSSDKAEMPPGCNAIAELEPTIVLLQVEFFPGVNRSDTSREANVSKKTPII
jgi:hypothetical protein